MELRDPKTLGVAVRIQRWLDNIVQGNPVSASDLRWLIGNTRLMALNEEIKAARKERDEKMKRKATDDITDGEVPGYIAALHTAMDRTKGVPVEFHSSLFEGTKARGRAAKKWKKRRDASKAAQEALQEAWEIVDPKYHHLFKAPPPGGWADEGKTLANFEWPPHLPLKELEARPETHLVHAPLHQYAEVLEAELQKLLVPAPVSPVDALQGRMARLTAIVAG